MGKFEVYVKEIDELIFDALMKDLRDAEDVCEYVLKRLPVATRVDIYLRYDHITRQFYS
jgi:hypothetical protein